MEPGTGRLHACAGKTRAARVLFPQPGNFFTPTRFSGLPGTARAQNNRHAKKRKTGITFSDAY